MKKIISNDFRAEQNKMKNVLLAERLNSEENNRISDKKGGLTNGM